jgi:signal transduction histidine kinase
MKEKLPFEAFFYGTELPLVIFKGPEMVVEMLNKNYQAIYPNRDLLGKPFFEVITELKESKFPSILKRVYETGESYISHEGLSKIYNPSTGIEEERYFDTTFSRVSYAENEPYRILATPKEVTERVMTRKKLEETVDSLEKEREFREIFIAALTHDLRTPLAVVKLATQVLQKKIDVDKNIKDLILRMLGSIDHADYMIRDLLDVNRIRAGEWVDISVEECRLDLIIDHTVSELSKIYENRLLFLNEAYEVNGFWDKLAIRRLVENLVTNAIKYGRSESFVTIKLSSVPSGVEISVHNEGNPIAPEEQKLLFSNYKRSQSAIDSGVKGWGIGLALVKGLAEAHQGKVRVESHAEFGTTFTIELPLDSRR